MDSIKENSLSETLPSLVLCQVREGIKLMEQLNDPLVSLSRVCLWRNKMAEE